MRSGPEKCMESHANTYFKCLKHCMLETIFCNYLDILLLLLIKAIIIISSSSSIIVDNYKNIFVITFIDVINLFKRK